MLPLALLALLVVALAAGAVALTRRGKPEPIAVVAVVEEHEQKPQRREQVLTEAVPAPATISGAVEPPRPRALVLLPPQAKAPEGLALDALDALLEELESTTVRIDGADALDEGSVAELEELAGRLEAAAASFAAR
jgi:hypothetical protein